VVAQKYLNLNAILEAQRRQQI